MSDTIVNPMGTDRRRTLASIGAAVVIHAAALILVSLAVTLTGPASPEIATPIDLQLASGPETAGPALSPTSVPGPAPSSAQASAAALPGPGPGASAGGAFVIPTVRGPAPDSTSAAAGGASFRETGGRTGAGGALPAVQNQLPQPVVAASQQGRSSGAGTASGAAAGNVQRGGEGVLVGPDKGSAGSLDLSKLDQAISGRGDGAAATAGAATGAARGEAGAGQAGGRTGQGGAATGQQGQAGAGGANGAGGYRVVWDQPDASKGRELLSAPTPKIPRWVSTQGLTLSITVAFVLMPDGVVSGVSLEQSSGYADVDSAIIDAIRRWKFTAAKGAGPVKGLIPYVIKSK